MSRISQRNLAIVAFACGLSVVFLAQTRLAQRQWSLTYDETYYLNCALQSVNDGRLDWRLSYGGVGPLPVLLTQIPAAWTVPPSDRPNLWIGDFDHPRINKTARRWNSLLIGLPLVLFVSGWLLKRRGLGAAALGGTMMAFSPTILAHSSLATMDAAAALFSLISIAVLARWYGQPSRLNFLLAGLSIGLAMSAKYSAIFLFPVAGFLLILHTWPKMTGGRLRRCTLTVFRSSIGGGLLFVVAITTLWSTDGFSCRGPLKSVPLEETPPDSPWIKVFGNGPLARRIMDHAHRDWKRPSVVSAIITQWEHNKWGHHAYFKGQHSKTGWTLYFPCAWLWKSTLPELVLTLGLIPLFCLTWRMGGHDDPRFAKTRLVWIIAFVLFWMMVLTAQINIGQRYLMPLVPLTVLLAIDLAWLAFAKRTCWLWGIGVLLAALQIQSALAISPHYLAYFSPVVGGPENGRHYLVDSNLDWGQDLPALRQALEQHGYRAPLLEYFGTALPEAYGISAARFTDVSLDELDRFDVFAVSVTKLQGDYLAPEDPFQEFRNLEPTARAGYSIFLYDLSEGNRRALLRRAWERYPTSVREEMRSRPRLSRED